MHDVRQRELQLEAFTRLAHSSTPLSATRMLYLMITYNEDNIRLLLALFLEVFAKTCTLHYTSFCQLQQRAKTGVFRDSNGLKPPFRCTT